MAGIDRSWPIGLATLRKAIGYKPDQGDADELAFFAASICERIDYETGRDADPTRHLVTITQDGAPVDVVPLGLIMAARTLARFWWQQEKNGPRGLPAEVGDQPAAGVPMGIDLPRKVQGILALFPPPPGFGQPETSS